MEIVEIIKIAIPIAIGFGGAYYLIFKKKLNALREFIDHLDDAVTDDKVTEEEFQKLWSSFKHLVGK